MGLRICCTALLCQFLLSWFAAFRRANSSIEMDLKSKIWYPKSQIYKEQKNQSFVKRNIAVKRMIFSIPGWTQNLLNHENGGSNHIRVRLVCLPYRESAFQDVSISVSVAPQCHFSYNDTGSRSCYWTELRQALTAPISSKARPASKCRLPAKNRWK